MTAIEKIEESIPKASVKVIGDPKGIRPVITNAGWLLAQRVIGFFLVFLVSVLIARYLGVKNYGMYSYALSFVALFAVFADLGLDTIVVRSLLDKSAEPGEILGTAFLLKLTAGLGAFMLTGAAIWLINDNSSIRLLTILIAVTIVFRSTNVIDFWFQSKSLSKYMALAYVAAIVVTAGLRIGFIYSKAPMLVFAAVAVVEQAIISAGLVFWFKRRGFAFRSWGYVPGLAKVMMHDSWPLIFSGLSVVIYVKIDQIMLGQMVGPAAVGVYAAAVTLSEGWAFIPIAVATSVFPALIRSRQMLEPAPFNKRIQSFYDVMALVGFGVAVVVTVAANTLVNILFGTGYEATAQILVVHIWSFVFICLGIARTKWLIAENMIKFSMFATMLGAIVNIVLNAILIPKYAGLGAAWATLVAYAVASYLSCVFSAQARPAFKQLTLALFAPFRLPAVLASIRELR